MLSAGEILGHYKILRSIGHGGMGEVYLAQDFVLDRKVAIKILPESAQQHPDARKRFLREAKAAAALDHPFICKVYDTGDTNGQAYIAMEYVAGETLKNRLARGPLSLKESLQKACEIAEALEEAHDKGVVHRDLKPSNIILTPQGHAKITDFGLAKHIAPAAGDSETDTGSGDLTQAGTLVGTLAYMSPEQARGESVDARSDIFSFGVIIYEMLSGIHPFLRASQIETLSAILRDPPPPLQAEAASSPPALRVLLNRALAKNPAERYQSARELFNDLRNLSEELAPQGRPTWSIWILASTVVLALALFTGWWWLAGRKAQRSAVAASHPPLSVLISDFENRTGEAVFDAVLEKALEVGLEGAPFITSYSRAEARGVGRKIQPGAARLDKEMARLIAQREGINVVLAGSIAGSSKGYPISIEAVDSFSGRLTTSRKIHADTKDDVLGAMAKLAVQIRGDLGDSQAQSTQLIPSETFTSSSLEAARSYAVAQDLQAVGKWREAIQAFSHAVQLDPDFARAYAGMAASSYNLRQYQEAQKYYQMAMARIDRMTDREKYRTRGGYYLMTRNYQQAIEQYSSLSKQYPADAAGLSNLALAYFFGRDMMGALKQGRKAVDIYPKMALIRGNLALYAMYAGDFDTANSEAAKVLEQNPGYETAYVAQAVAALAGGRVAEAQQIYQRLASVSSSGASLSAMGLADLALYEGRLGEGAAILERGIAGDLAINKTSAGAKLGALAQTRLRQGLKSEAVDIAARAIEASREERVLFEAANVYMEAGRTTEALQLAKILGARIEPEPQVFARLVEGRIQSRRGGIKNTMRLLEETQKRLDTWLGRFDSGRAYLEAGAFTEAYSQFEQCLKRRGEATAVFLDDVPTMRYLPPVYYYLGRAQEGLKSPAAADSYGAFLAIRGKSTEDPLVADTRRRINR